MEAANSLLTSLGRAQDLYLWEERFLADRLPKTLDPLPGIRMIRKRVSKQRLTMKNTYLAHGMFIA